jgi:hypothetical protein
MMLYVNGDSHSHGVGVAIHERFSNIVAHEFNQDTINDAKVGASNQRILRTTQQYLETHRPSLVLIGWSTWEREEWYYQNQYYDVNSSGHTGLPVELQEKYKEWVTKQTPETLNIKSQQFHDQIYQLHQELEQKNIKHLFFNCMYNFFNISDNQKKDWNNCYIGPYDNDSSYYWYLNNQGYVSDEWYHFGSHGHAEWARKLINYIKEHNII